MPIFKTSLNAIFLNLKKMGQDLIQQLSPKQLHLGWRSRFTIHIISITLSLCLPQQPGRSRFRNEKQIITLVTVWSGWVTFIHLCWRSNSLSRSLNSSFSSGRHWKLNAVICFSMFRCIEETEVMSEWWSTIFSSTFVTKLRIMRVAYLWCWAFLIFWGQKQKWTWKEFLCQKAWRRMTIIRKEK